MRKLAVLGVLLGSLLVSAMTAAAAEERLTVVELFTSQACPHSPGGDNNLAILAERDDLLALTFPVTYWDYFGWKDTFAHQAFTNRQKNYIRHMPDQWLYTPQLVVQGRVGVNGDDLDAVYDTVAGVAATLEGSHSVLVRAVGAAQEVNIPAHDLTSSATLNFVAWEPGPLTVNVTSGKNAGQALQYVNVVRSLVQVDELSPGTSASLLVDIPDDAKGLPCAFLLQDKESGSVLAAARCQ